MCDRKETTKVAKAGLVSLDKRAKSLVGEVFVTGPGAVGPLPALGFAGLRLISREGNLC